MDSALLLNELWPAAVLAAVFGSMGWIFTRFMEPAIMRWFREAPARETAALKHEIEKRKPKIEIIERDFGTIEIYLAIKILEIMRIMAFIVVHVGIAMISLSVIDVFSFTYEPKGENLTEFTVTFIVVICFIWVSTLLANMLSKIMECLYVVAAKYCRSTSVNV